MKSINANCRFNIYYYYFITYKLDIKFNLAGLSKCQNVESEKTIFLWYIKTYMFVSLNLVNCTHYYEIHFKSVSDAKIMYGTIKKKNYISWGLVI